MLLQFLTMKTGPFVADKKRGKNEHFGTLGLENFKKVVSHSPTLGFLSLCLTVGFDKHPSEGRARAAAA